MWRIKAAGESSLKGQLHKKQEFLTSRRTHAIIPPNATLTFLFIYLFELTFHYLFFRWQYEQH